MNIVRFYSFRLRSPTFCFAVIIHFRSCIVNALKDLVLKTKFGFDDHHFKRARHAHSKRTRVTIHSSSLCAMDQLTVSVRHSSYKVLPSNCIMFACGNCFDTTRVRECAHKLTSYHQSGITAQENSTKQSTKCVCERV